jgi:hypothetical protein
MGQLAISRAGAGPQGPVGAQGVKGDPGSNDYVYRANTWGASTALAASVWKALPSAGGGTIQPAGAFTEVGLDAVTVRDAGYYEVSAFAYFTAVVGASCNLSIGGNTATGENFGAEASGVQDKGTQLHASGIIYINAGQTIWVTGISTAVSNVQLRGFSIVRIGAGPAGPTGPQGPTSFPAASNLNFNNFKAIQLGYPTNSQDAASKQYVDDVTLEQIVNFGTPTKIAWGSITQSVVGQTAGTFTINHGMGAAPVWATCIAFDLADPTKMVAVNWRSATSTQLVFSYKRIGAATTTDTHTFYWAAIVQP